MRFQKCCIFIPFFLFLWISSACGGGNISIFEPKQKQPDKPDSPKLESPASKPGPPPDVSQPSLPAPKPPVPVPEDEDEDEDDDWDEDSIYDNDKSC